MNTDQLLEKRKEVIGLYNKNTRVMEIVEKTGLTWPTVNKAIKLYELCEAGGMGALQPKMGRTKGSGRILNPGQEEEIKNILYTKQPRDVGIIFLEGTYIEAPKEDDPVSEISDCLMQNLPVEYPQHLWCRDSVRVLIKIKTDAELSPRGVDKYLDRWGFPKKKQNQRLTDNCSQIIQQWLENNPPSDMGSEIYWLDRKRLATKKKQSIISATDKHQRVLWTVIQGNFSQKEQQNFLDSLSQQSRRRITVIRNDYKHYTSDQVKKWLAKNNITLYPPLLEGEATNIENDRKRDREAYKELREERELEREQKREIKLELERELELKNEQKNLKLLKLAMLKLEQPEQPEQPEQLERKERKRTRLEIYLDIDLNLELCLWLVLWSGLWLGVEEKLGEDIKQKLKPELKLKIESIIKLKQDTEVDIFLETEAEIEIGIEQVLVRELGLEAEKIVTKIESEIKKIKGKLEELEELEEPKKREETKRERIKRERWVSKLVEEQVAKRDPYDDLNSGNISTLTNAVNANFDLNPDDLNPDDS